MASGRPRQSCGGPARLKTRRVARQAGKAAQRGTSEVTHGRDGARRFCGFPGDRLRRPQHLHPGTSQSDIRSASYRVTRKLGQGGMGSVWVATHLGLEVDVSINLMAPSLLSDAGARARFRELRAGRT